MDILRLYSAFLECGRVTTDSRAISGGEMFFGLKGENFDGNEYALKALEAGARYAVVDEGSMAAASGDPRVIAVPDTLAALQALARHHRENTFVDGKRLTVIGLTGTNGKTTTKELITRVLSVKYNVTSTQGNLNNDIGVPLSVLGINSKTQIAVIEMGASHPDDIEKLVKVSEPDYGIITNVGKGHLLGFGSYDGVKKAKGKLYDYILEHGTSIFLNADDPILVGMAAERKGLKAIEYGVNYWGAIVLPSDADHPFVRMAIPDSVTEPVASTSSATGNTSVPELVDAVGNPSVPELVEGPMSRLGSPIAEATDRTENLLCLETHLAGAYNANNIATAIAVGLHFGVSLEDAIQAVSEYIPKNNRSQLEKTGRNILIEDAYNANPTSMAAALDNLASVQAPQKAAMLGEMRELGEESVSEHVIVLEKLAAMNLDLVCLVGEEFRKALDSERMVRQAHHPSTSAHDTAALAPKSATSVPEAAAPVPELVEGPDVKNAHHNSTPVPELVEGPEVRLGSQVFETISNVKWFPTSDDLVAWLKEHPVSDHTILIKGSRGNRMEKVLSEL